MLLCLLALLAASPAAAVTHAKVHKSHHSALTPNLRYWHFSRYSRMFPGSHDLLVQQNEELNRLQLPRISMRENSYGMRFRRCWFR